MRQNNKNYGFTIIELTLAMSFVSVLLLIIATTTLQVANVYNKGLTLKKVNQSGRFLTEELSRIIKSSYPFDLNSGVRYNKDRGRLCTGEFSFIWNTGTKLLNPPNNINKYINDNTEIRFISVHDPESKYCSDLSLPIDKSKSTELLDSTNYKVVIHDFAISSLDSAYDSSTRQRLYTINFNIGTNEVGTLTGNGADTACTPPNGITSNFNFCATGKFYVLARAGDTIESN